MSEPARPWPAVAGVVLAAGRSIRMGQPKALLPVAGRTFLEHAVAILREGGCDPVLAVVPAGSPGLALEAEGAGGRAVVSPDPDAEQVESLRIGLAAIGSGAAAAIVLPVDFPHARPKVVEALIDAFRESGAPIVRPVHRGVPGHPVLFARDLWTELSDPDLEEGARDVVHRHRAEIVEVPVEDRGVTVDVDTPEDYEREIGPP
ncbi:MAG TPA: nucleotidyltransferase family protein [Gemmatimonadota bacterium]|nr:nucleotidyltransferase family protein [Gemmatimonadota bacterium]